MTITLMRVPAVIALVIGLLAVIVAQVMVAHELWKERNEAQEQRNRAVAARDEAVEQLAAATDRPPQQVGISIEDSQNVRAWGNATIFGDPPTQGGRSGPEGPKKS